MYRHKAWLRLCRNKTPFALRRLVRIVRFSTETSENDNNPPAHQTSVATTAQTERDPGISSQTDRIVRNLCGAESFRKEVLKTFEGHQIAPFIESLDQAHIKALLDSISIQPPSNWANKATHFLVRGILQKADQPNVDAFSGVLARNIKNVINSKNEYMKELVFACLRKQENFWESFNGLSISDWRRIASDARYYEIILLAITKRTQSGSETFYSFLDDCFESNLNLLWGYDIVLSMTRSKNPELAEQAFERCRENWPIVMKNFKMHILSLISEVLGTLLTGLHITERNKNLSVAFINECYGFVDKTMPIRRSVSYNSFNPDTWMHDGHEMAQKMNGISEKISKVYFISGLLNEDECIENAKEEKNRGDGDAAVFNPAEHLTNGDGIDQLRYYE